MGRSGKRSRTGRLGEGRANESRQLRAVSFAVLADRAHEAIAEDVQMGVEKHRRNAADELLPLNEARHELSYVNVRTRTETSLHRS